MKILINHTSTFAARNGAGELLGIVQPNEDTELPDSSTLTLVPFDSFMRERLEKGITLEATDPLALTADQVTFLPPTE